VFDLLKASVTVEVSSNSNTYFSAYPSFVYHPNFSSIHINFPDSDGISDAEAALQAQLTATAQALHLHSQEAIQGYEALVQVIASVMGEYSKSVLQAFQMFFKKYVCSHVVHCLLLVFEENCLWHLFFIVIIYYA